jgi:ribosome-associated translation inhibitor RaiA
VGIPPIEQPAIQPRWRIGRAFGVGTRIAFSLVMHAPIQVTFRNMSAHEALSEAVRSRAHWLEAFDPDVAGCRVALEFPHRHKQHGRPFSIHIHLSLPGEDVTVRHEALLHQSVAAFYDADTARGDHRDAIAAINAAFDIARRRLEDVARKRRGD